MEHVRCRGQVEGSHQMEWHTMSCGMAAVQQDEQGSWQRSSAQGKAKQSEHQSQAKNWHSAVLLS